MKVGKTIMFNSIAVAGAFMVSYMGWIGNFKL